MDLLFWIAVFIVSLIVLLKSSDYFTDTAEKIGIHFGIPAFIVGVTIVSIGTSMPELASSVIAAFGGAPEFVVGNVLGSNITNILLILGVIAVVGKKMKLTWELIRVDLPLLMGSAILVFFMLSDGIFSFTEAIICILGYLIYVAYVTSIHRKPSKKKRKLLGWKTPLILVLSCIGIYVGARFTVESVLQIADILMISTGIIAASIVALGTSLPELSVSLTAAKKGKAELAIGNILGSNILNSFLVLGASGAIATLVVPAALLVFILPFFLGVTLLYFFITQDNRITRWEGWMLILIYIFFLIKIFGII